VFWNPPRTVVGKGTKIVLRMFFGFLRLYLAELDQWLRGFVVDKPDR